MAPEDRHYNIATALAPVVVGVAVLRLVVAVAVGIDVASGGGDYPGGRDHAGAILQGFGTGGGAVGAILAVAAVVLVVLSPRGSVALRSVTRVVVVLTAVLIIAGVSGAVVLQSDVAPSWATISAVGFGLADTVLCLGGAAAVFRLGPPPAAASAVETRMLFAVDRVDGEVFAFLSEDEARRTLSAYSVEDEEFDFYAVDGTLIEATVEDERIVFTPTEEDRRPDLLARLRRFAELQGLTVDDERRNDPDAYVMPVNDWQWLQLWPGWLRPIGRLVRALSGPSVQDRRSKSIAE